MTDSKKLDLILNKVDGMDCKVDRLGDKVDGLDQKDPIAGLIGNMIGECKMNPGQWERWKQTTGKTSGYGICQWTPSKPFFKIVKKGNGSKIWGKDELDGQRSGIRKEKL